MQPDLLHTLNHNILSPDIKYFNTQVIRDKKASDILVAKRYKLNLEKTSLICLDASGISYNLYPHTHIIKDVHGIYFSPDFHHELNSSQIDELLQKKFILSF